MQEPTLTSAARNGQIDDHDTVAEQPTQSQTATCEAALPIAAEARIAQLSRLYRVLSEINQTIVRSHDQQALFEQVCRVAVEHGQFHLAWIGLVDAPTSIVRPVARSGHGVDVIDRVEISVQDIAEGQGIVGTAIRTGACAFSNDVLSDDRMLPWRKEQEEIGIQSGAAFPIRLNGVPIGAMAMYSSQRCFFDTDELRLLEELAGDVAFALEMMEKEGQREAAEAALQASEERYRIVYEKSPLAFVIWSPEQGVLDWNLRAKEVFGWDRDEMMGRDMQSITLLEDRHQLVLSALRLLNGSAEDVVTTRNITKSRQVISCEWRSTLLADSGGRPASILSMGLDITERQRAEETRSRLAAIVEYSEDAVIGKTVDGIVTDWNPAARRLYGYSTEEMIGAPIATVIPEQVADELKTLLNCVREGESIPRYETIRRRKDGSLIDVSISISPIRNASGTVVGAATISRDISERKRTENALRESEARFRRLAENARDMIVRCDLKRGRRYTYVSPSVTRILGYAPEDFYRDPDLGYKLIHPDDRHLMDALFNGQGLLQATERWKHKGGHIVWLEMQHVYVRDDEGELVALECTGRDVSKRIRAEESLREQNELLQTIVSNIPVMVNYFDADGSLVWGNQQWTKTLEWTAEDMAGGNLLEKVYPDPKRRRRAQEAIRKADGRWTDFKNHTRDGRVLDVTWAYICLSNGANIGIGLDITERKRLEEQLMRAQRLETAGRVAGQVAHDFNNLLGPITVYPELIAASLPPDSPAAGYCEIITEAARHIAEINGDLLALARRGRLETEAVDVNRFVRQAVEQLGDRPPALSTNLDLSDTLLPAEGSASQILRVLQNLIANARDAMRDEGVLTIGTENIYVDAPMGSYNRVARGEYVKIWVSDTGSGIPEEIRDKIFDAFFSTKRGNRRGCGLGLTVVQSIVADHSGFIDLTTEEGIGTTFTLYFPVSRNLPKREQPDAARTGHERILVVDDDPLQRSVIVEILRSRGYHASAVPSGEAALEHLREHMVELVILDMVMPGGMDGAETYRELLREHPRQRALLISGYADTEQVRMGLDLGAGAFLRKPVAIHQLAAAVRQELDRP